jgi:hypothetical protein
MSARPHGGVTSTVKAPPPLPSAAARPAASGAALPAPTLAGAQPGAAVIADGGTALGLSKPGAARPKPPARPARPAQKGAPLQSLIVPRGPKPSVPELWQDEDEAQWLLKLAKARVAAAEAEADEDAEWRAALARAQARVTPREPELAHTTSTVRAISPPPDAEPDWDALLQVARARAVHDEAAGLLQPKAPKPARPAKPRRPTQSGTFAAVGDFSEASAGSASVRRLPPPIPRRSSGAGASADPFAPLVPFTPPQREAQVVSWPPVALMAG